MAVESAADRAIFVSPDDFGVTASYTQNEGTPVPINGIFDRSFLAIETGDGSVTGVSVTFTCRADDLEPLLYGRARQGDRVTVDGENWTVVEPQSDGTGMVVLILQKEA